MFFIHFILLNSSTCASKEIDLETLELEVNNDLKRDEEMIFHWIYLVIFCLKRIKINSKRNL